MEFGICLLEPFLCVCEFLYCRLHWHEGMETLPSRVSETGDAYFGLEIRPQPELLRLKFVVPRLRPLPRLWGRDCVIHFKEEVAYLLALLRLVVWRHKDVGNPELLADGVAQMPLLVKICLALRVPVTSTAVYPLLFSEGD